MKKNEYPMVELGTVLSLIRNGLSIKQSKDADGLPITRIETISNGEIDSTRVGYAGLTAAEHGQWMLKPGDVLLSHINSEEHLGKVAMYDGIPGQLIHGMNLLNLRADSSVILPRYLLRVLRSELFRRRVRRVANRSVNQASVSITALSGIEIPLPPLPEQRRIADILDKADAIRRKRREAVEDVTTFSFSVFHQMFGEPRRNPHKWPSSPLSALVREDDKINYGVVQPGQDYPGGVPIVRVGDFDGMKINKTEIKRIDPEIEANYKRSRLVGDEVLLACVGSIGLVALADESLRGFNTVRAVARIRCGAKLNRKYLAYYISTPFLQSFFLQSTRTVSQPTLNIGTIEETNVLVPPIALQEQFAAVLAKHEETVCRFDESANSSECLFNSLVQRAFRGEL